MKNLDVALMAFISMVDGVTCANCIRSVQSQLKASCSLCSCHQRQSISNQSTERSMPKVCPDVSFLRGNCKAHVACLHDFRIHVNAHGVTKSRRQNHLAKFSVSYLTSAELQLLRQTTYYTGIRISSAEYHRKDRDMKASAT